MPARHAVMVDNGLNVYQTFICLLSGLRTVGLELNTRDWALRGKGYDSGHILGHIVRRRPAAPAACRRPARRQPFGPAPPELACPAGAVAAPGWGSAHACLRRRSPQLYGTHHQRMKAGRAGPPAVLPGRRPTPSHWLAFRTALAPQNGPNRVRSPTGENLSPTGENQPPSGPAGCAASACLLTRWWPMAAAPVPTCAITAWTHGAAPNAGPHVQPGWWRSARTRRKRPSSGTAGEPAQAPPSQCRPRALSLARGWRDGSMLSCQPRFVSSSACHGRAEISRTRECAGWARHSEA